MPIHETTIRATIDLFNQAALGVGNWTHAMEAFAANVNARTGQLIGFGSHQSVPFNVMTNMAEEAASEFLVAGGGNRDINSRVRVGLDAPELALRDDRHFDIEQERRASPAFYDWQVRHRVGYTCLTTLMRHDDYTVGVASISDLDRPPIADDDRRNFRLLSHELRQAIKLQVSLEGRQAQLIAGSFETFDQAAFVCGPGCRVVAYSAMAERLLEEGRWFNTRGGTLRIADQQAQRSLEAFVDQRSTGDNYHAVRNSNQIIARDRQGYPLLLECAPFPMQNDITILSHSIIIAHAPQQNEDRTAKLAKSLFTLTPTEAIITAYLCSGHGPLKIADRCGVARGTVRTHLKRIFDKTATRSQVELVALLASYR